MQGQGHQLRSMAALPLEREGKGWGSRMEQEKLSALVKEEELMEQGCYSPLEQVKVQEVVRGYVLVQWLV
eukprot:5738946-Amphidinium_carterae.1